MFAWLRGGNDAQLANTTYTGRESASARKERKATERAAKLHKERVARHRRLGAQEQRRAADRGWF